MMTVENALNEIVSVKGWYHIYNEHNDAERDKKEARLRMIAINIKRGIAKPSTMQQFFSLFGYEYLIKEEVNKK